MNRPLKFRAYDKYTKKFYYSSEFQSLIEPANVDMKMGFSLNNYRYKNNIDYNDLVFQQSVGLYDKNDNDIFEGDIVKVLPHPTLVEVKYIPSRFGVSTKYGFLILNADSIDSIEIVGNVCQNPDLLK